MSLEEDYLMKEVAKLNERVTALENGERVDVQEPIPVAEGASGASEDVVVSDDTDEDVEGAYDEFSNEDLRAELERRGLPKSGKKEELITRLEEDDEAQEAEDEDE